ncbi:TetR/AcrR family transcriptional regulator [Kribbella sp. NPDC051587]|uniref:TetR/AcrR family transcriptional regulator n=1 Tax=Kribbella sp. NPDC051587 TaxID=3364119 RepID=UPI003794A774
MSANPGEAPQARERILDAAAEAFMADGFVAATIDDVARLVGATKGLVYYHFRSKFDLLLAVYEEAMRRARNHVEPFATGDADGFTRLSAMAVAHEHNLMQHLAYHQVVHQVVRGEMSFSLKARQREALIAANQLRADHEQLFRGVLEEGIADGTLRPVDSALATRTLLSSLNSVDTWFRPRPGQTVDELHELATQIVDLLVGGLAQR